MEPGSKVLPALESVEAPPSSRMCRQLVVLGMHRSGTSATAGLLATLGAYVGSADELTPTTIENPKGFFERREARAICDALLHSAGADWWKVRDFYPERIPPSVLIEEGKAFQRLVADLDSHGTWAIKEPRLCLLLPVLRRYLTNPVAILVMRHPMQVAQSLRRRNAFSRSAALALWEAYVVTALRNSEGIPRTIISYERLVADPVGSTEALKLQLGSIGVVGLTDADPMAAIDPSLHREHVDGAGFDALVTPQQRALWEHLSRGQFPPPDLLRISEASRLILEDFEIDRSAAVQDAARRVDAAKLKEAERQAAATGAKAKQLAEELANARAELKRAVAGADARLAAALTEQTAKQSALRLEADARLAAVNTERDAVEAALRYDKELLEGRVKAAFQLVEALGRAGPRLARRLPELAAELYPRLRTLSNPEGSAGTASTALAEHHSPRPRRRGIAGYLERWAARKAAKVLERSGLFDADWYRRSYPETAILGLDPLYHYLQYGGFQGLDPSPRFSSSWYLSKYKDVEKAGVNPLLHYARHGAREGREPLPPERRADDAAELSQQASSEDAALVSASPLFDKAWYLSRYEDVRRKGLNPVIHYLRIGAQELRDPGPAFSTSWYLRKYDDIRRLGANPLVHFLRHGQKEGRLAAPPKDRSVWWRDLAPPADSQGAALDVGAALARAQRNPAPPAIVIPVYNAAPELEECLAAVVRHSGTDRRVLVLDDASPDRRIGDVMAEYARFPGLELHRNDTNLGFTRTVNRGIELAGRSDVILLNSDTKVTPGWIRNLRLAAYSGEKVGTATPLSNNAGAFSAPEFGKANEVPAWLALDDYGRAVSQASLRLYPETPTGNGFCMYLRRDCLDETGMLDADAFPRGYGEENDFCMRARRLGWRHVVDDATLIYHARSASFGDEKTDLMKRGRTVVDKRHPDYTRAVSDFIGSEAFRRARERVRDVASAITPGSTAVKPRILFVLATRTGGTPQTNEDLMVALGDRIEAFVLRCTASTVTLMHFGDGVYTDLERHDLTEPLRAFPHRSAEYDAVASQWLVRYAIELVHIRHIAWHGLGLIDSAKAIGLPVVFSFHDFYTVCPTVKLLDEAGVYCGGTCTATKGECQHQLWREPDFPPLKHAAIRQWREQIAAALERCDAFVTTSKSARDTLVEAHPFLADRDFTVIRHGRDFERFGQAAPVLRSNDVIRIVVPGNISNAKGGAVIAELGRLAAEHRLELHVLGTIEDDVELPATIVRHGKYDRRDFLQKVRQIAPHLGGVFSLWPETYCHTLTELWACGIPVIGFDFGAVGERLRETGAGWLSAEPTAAGVMEVIDRMRSTPAEHADKVSAVHAWQKGAALRDSCRHMGHTYFDLYRSLVERGEPEAVRARPRVAVVAPGVRLRGNAITSAMGSTYVRLVAKTVDSFARGVRFDFCEKSAELHLLPEQYDAIMVQRTALDQDAAAELIANLSKRGRPLLLDLDDDLIERARLARDGDEYAGYQKAIEALVHAARMVFVSTDTLKERVEALNPQVVVEPNAIWARYWLSPLQSAAGDAAAARRSSGETRAIYMGTRTHAADLALLKDAVAKVRKAVAGFRLFTVGVTDAEQGWYESIPIPSDRRNYPEFVTWLRGIFLTMDFAVAPLADTPFNRAKSDLKFLEYSAARLACVASSVGAYRSTVRHGETGLLADNTTEAWCDQLLFAARNGPKLADIAARAHSEVVQDRLVRHREAALDAAVLSALEGASVGSS